MGFHGFELNVQGQGRSYKHLSSGGNRTRNISQPATQPPRHRGRHKSSNFSFYIMLFRH